MTREQGLLKAYIRSRKAKEDSEETFEEAKRHFHVCESELIRYLEDHNATSTAKYKDLGKVTLPEERLYAHCPAEYSDCLKDFLVEKGREDLIKGTVHHGTLTSFVKELILKGEKVPEYISTYFKKTLKHYK